MSGNVFLFGSYICSVWYHHLVYILFLMRVGFRLCPVSISQSYPGKKCVAIHRPPQFAQKPCSALAHTNTKIKSNNYFRCVSIVKLPLLGPRKSGTGKSSVNMLYFCKNAHEMALVNPLFWSARPQDEIIEGCPMWHVTWAANLLLHF